MKMWEFVRTTQRRMRQGHLEAGEASYLSGFIGGVLFKVWKVFASNEADVVKEPGKEGGLDCPYIYGRDD